MVGAGAVTTFDIRLGNQEWADNWTVGPGLRFELIETATGRVFLSQEPASAAEVASFHAPDGFAHILAGEAVADMAFFARSPAAVHDGPVDTLELGGRRFAFVARPVESDRSPSGADVLTIDKHHAMLYRAGRTLDVLDFGDGTVATPAWSSADPTATVTDDMLTVGWTLRRVRLVDDLLTFIPNPAQVIVLDQAFGFHGPVDRAVIDRATQEVPAP